MEHDPFIAVAGSSIFEMTDCALVCNQKVVFHLQCGLNIANMSFVLAAFCHFYNLRYSPLVEDLMEFFQVKLIGLSEKKKYTVALTSVLRAIQGQQELTKQSQIDGVEEMDHVSADSDATRLDYQIDSQVTLLNC